MSEKRFSWKTEKLQHSDDEVIMVVDNANKEWKGHILNIVDKLNELNDERMMYKTTIDKRIVELEEENEKLKYINDQLEKRLENSGIGVALKMDYEKRKIQKFNLDEGRIWEAIEGLSPYKTTYTLEEVCEKLNEQQDTIRKLQDLCGESDGENAKLRIENKRLEEENEQLKQKLENLGLNEKNDMVEYSIEDFFRWLQRIKKEFEDFEDRGF